MARSLDYKIAKEFSLAIKIEDNAVVGQRRSVTVTFDVKVTFESSNTVDPEVKREIELTFPDADYDAVVLGNEANFIAALAARLSSSYRAAIFVHFVLRKGSVIATFDMIMQQSNVSSLLNQLANEVESTTGLIVTYNGQDYATNKMKVDSKIYKAASDEDDDNLALVCCQCWIL